jgi:membrane protein YqaA with SNARE-associated domain
LKHFIAKLSAFIWTVMHALGAWGVVVIAAADGAGIPLPGAVDAVVASYVFANPARAWMYVPMAAAGSALGCLVLYAIGYAGGEALLRRRMPEWKFDKMRRSFDQHAISALMIPAILPPPFPFKIMVLAASAFEMPVVHFLLSIFAGRLARFAALAVLTIFFGPGIVTVVATLFTRHLALTLIIVAAAVAIFLLIRRTNSRRSQISSNEANNEAD